MKVPDWHPGSGVYVIDDELPDGYVPPSTSVEVPPEEGEDETRT